MVNKDGANIKREVGLFVRVYNIVNFEPCYLYTSLSSHILISQGENKKIYSKKNFIDDIQIITNLNYVPKETLECNVLEL